MYTEVSGKLIEKKAMTSIRQILLVNNNHPDREFIREAVDDELGKVEYIDIKSEENWHRSLRFLEFDLVITGFQLGWTDGLKILQRIKLEKPFCPVIMYTESMGEEIAVEAMKNGLHDYIIKTGDQSVRLRSAIKSAADQVMQRKALIEAEIRYRELFQGIPIGLYQTSPEGRFITVNRSMVHMLGYPDEKTLLAIHTSDLYADKSYYNRWKSSMVQSGQVRSLEVEMKRFDSKLIWVEINGKQVYKDGVLFYNDGSLQDVTSRVEAQKDLELHVKRVEDLAITNSRLYDQVHKYNRELERKIDERTKELKLEIVERKKSADALRLSEEKYRSVVDQVREIIFQLDKSHHFVFLNKAWEVVTSTQVGDVLHKKIYDFIHPDDRAALKEDLKLLQSKKMTHLQQQYRLNSAGKKERWVEIVADRMNGDVKPAIFGTMFDISERKLADEEIQRALAKEKELSQLRSQFVSMTSHEFRTPLSSILTSSELLEHYGRKWPKDKNLLHLQRIQNSVKQIISMMDDILILGKADAGKLDCVKEKLNLNEYIQSIAEEVRLNEKFTHTIDYHGTERLVYADKKIIRQIITNILSNALKYSEQGSTIKLSLEFRADDAIIRITDQGIGIPEPDQYQMFESFFRAGNVGNRPGTGLGLPIVKRSVEAHDGKIEIKSEMGKGTEVIIQIHVAKS